MYKDAKNEMNKRCTNQTKFYVQKTSIDPIGDAAEYFQWGADVDTDNRIAVVTNLNQLEAYTNYEIVLFICEDYEYIQKLWPRGVPISYKYGYEVRVIRPKALIIVTNHPDFYLSYKDISTI